MEKIQEILNKGIEEYKKKHKIVGYKQKVIGAIQNCKTGKMGAHKYVCDECGHEEMFLGTPWTAEKNATVSLFDF